MPFVDEPASRTYCKAAFEQLHIAIGGAVKPCCEFQGEIGNVRVSGPKQIWKSASLRDLRAKMQSNERDEGCRRCYEMEDAGVVSLRQFYNRVDPSERVTAEASDLPTKLDIRLSNLCNLKCRSCNADASSRWFVEGEKLGMLSPSQSSALINTFGPGGSALEILGPLFDTLEEINFAGGEPLLMEEQYAIVEDLIRRGRTDVHLSYISNMMQLRFGRRDILSLWSQFKRVHLTASIDGDKKAGELIRDGLSWECFTRNVSAVRRSCPHVHMQFNITVSVFNIHSLPNLCRSLNAIEGAGDVECTFTLLQVPRQLNIQILPAAMKAEVKRRLEEFAVTFGGTPSQSHEAMSVQVESVIGYMMSEDRSNEIKRFRRDTLRLDELRHQDTAATIPELASILQESFMDVCRRKAADRRRDFRRWAAKAFAAKAQISNG